MTVALPSLAPISAGRQTSARELVVLGTAGQVPTARRNHNGYLLRWNGEGILFDPGEGTQRQLLHTGISSSVITAICITHFHGDHCLGLPGVLARFALDQRERPVDLYFPGSGAEHLDRLRRAAAIQPWPGVRLHALGPAAASIERDQCRLVAAPLEHTIDDLGWRVEERSRRHLLDDRLGALGIVGPDRGRLLREGWLETPSGRVQLDDVSEIRPGQVLAFLMDTALCDAAVELADRADLVVCESTYLDDEADLAHKNRHLTARQAGWIAAESGARQLVLTHFSQRHGDERVYAREASDVFPAVVAARDLTVVAVPPRATAHRPSMSAAVTANRLGHA
jgi:ribonuclease Z